MQNTYKIKLIKGVGVLISAVALLLLLILTFWQSKEPIEIELEGVTISTNDNFHLKHMGYSKDEWSYYQKKTVLEILGRMTPLPDHPNGDIQGTGPILKIENDENSISVTFNVYNSRVRVNYEESKWYDSTTEDNIVIREFILPVWDYILPKGWNVPPGT